MRSAPQPLAGAFHELSIAVDDIRAAVEFYERLGFTQATTADTFAHPYGVLTDGRLFVGVHQRSPPSPVLTFVRPGIAASLAAFAAAGIELSRCQTGEEVFNEIAFEDPFGHAVAVLEARTYSPVTRGVTDTSLCGDFAELSLPAGNFAAAQRFWEPLGFVAAEEAQLPYPRLSLTSDHLDLAFHSPQLSRRPLLIFRDPGMQARIARLREMGVPVPAAPGFTEGNGDGVLLAGPGGTPLLLLGEAG